MDKEKQIYEMTFQEFSKKKSHGDFNPNLIQDAWVMSIYNAIKSGKTIPENILTSNSDIVFLINN